MDVGQGVGECSKLCDMSRSQFLLMLAAWIVLPWAAPRSSEAVTPPLSGPLTAPLPQGVAPQHVIDLLVAKEWAEQDLAPAPRCNDSEFVRRISLDLIGRIPTTTELEAFLSNTASHKREVLVDELLASPEHARHMAEIFDVVLMGRRGEAAVRKRESHGWPAYLRDVFARNRPWDRVVRELLVARPGPDDNPASVWFLYERKDDHQAIAETVASRLFGTRIDCAQCHDHPSVDEIEQRHYWGLVKVFKRTKNIETDAGPRVGESAVGGYVQFTDLAGVKEHAPLTFLGTGHALNEDVPADGDQESDDATKYREAETDGPPIPMNSRRQRFADEIVAGNPLIARAMVNRLWALMFGRGLVHPVTEMDSDHPPSHPILLDWLARDFAASNYDVRRLLRSMALSRPYQLASQPPIGAHDPATFAWALEKPLTAEAFYRSIVIAIEGQPRAVDQEVLASFRRKFSDVMPTVAVTSADQTMFLSNNPRLLGLIKTRPGNRLAELSAIRSPAAQAEKAIWYTFHREATASEVEQISQFLSKQTSTDGASRLTSPLSARLEQLMWALLTSAEFRFNH